jgi:hypothetical protein
VERLVCNPHRQYQWYKRKQIIDQAITQHSEGEDGARQVYALDQRAAPYQSMHGLRCGLGEKVPENQPYQQVDCVIFHLKAKKLGESDGKNQHGKQWIEQRPNHTQGRALIACFYAIGN